MTNSDKSFKPSSNELQERCFLVLLCCFAFTMLAGFFKTGFPATFSTLAIVFASIIVFRNRSNFELSRAEKVGVLLFIWLSLSLTWSGVELLDSLNGLFEYRFFLLLPLLSNAIFFVSVKPEKVIISGVCGALVALVFSYALGLDLVKIKGADNSLSDRIYHGFAMCLLLIFFLSLLGDKRSKALNLIGWCIIALIVLNLTTIETGRTAILALVAIILVWAFLYSNVKTSIVVLATPLMIGIIYISFDSFASVIGLTYENVYKALVVGDFGSGAGYRLDWYKAALGFGIENPWVGAGIGGVDSALALMFEGGAIKIATDNVHNEYLTMLIAGGWFATATFFIFCVSIILDGLDSEIRDGPVGRGLVLLGVLVIVYCSFNSSIKDFGEKHAILFVLSTLIGMSKKYKLQTRLKEFQ